MATHDPIAHETTARSATRRREQRKVVAGTIIGTSIESVSYTHLTLPTKRIV